MIRLWSTVMPVDEGWMSTEPGEILNWASVMLLPPMLAPVMVAAPGFWAWTVTPGLALVALRLSRP